MTLKDIVDFYKNHGIRGLKCEIERVKLLHEKSNPASPVYCPNSQVRKCFLFYCVRGDHQFRMKEYDIWEAVVKIETANILAATYNNFEELYDAVKNTIFKCKNVGELTVYDTALRIGFHLNVLPSKYVYLASGGLSGYNRMSGVTHPGPMLKIATSVIIAQFPDLSVLTAYEIEDFFCVCKDFFEKNGAIKSNQKCRKIETNKINDIKRYFDWNMRRMANGICVTH